MIFHGSKSFSFIPTRSMTSISITTRSTVPYLLWHYLLRAVSFKILLFFWACQRPPLGLSSPLHQGFQNITTIQEAFYSLSFCHLQFPLGSCPQPLGYFYPWFIVFCISAARCPGKGQKRPESPASRHCNAYCSCSYFFPCSFKSLLILL